MVISFSSTSPLDFALNARQPNEQIKLAPGGQVHCSWQSSDLKPGADGSTYKLNKLANNVRSHKPTAADDQASTK